MNTVTQGTHDGHADVVEDNSGYTAEINLQIP